GLRGAFEVVVAGVGCDGDVERDADRAVVPTRDQAAFVQGAVRLVDGHRGDPRGGGRIDGEAEVHDLAIDGAGAADSRGGERVEDNGVVGVIDVGGHDPVGAEDSGALDVGVGEVEARIVAEGHVDGAQAAGVVGDGDRDV